MTWRFVHRSAMAVCLTVLLYRFLQKAPLHPEPLWKFLLIFGYLAFIFAFDLKQAWNNSYNNPKQQTIGHLLVVGMLLLTLFAWFKL